MQELYRARDYAIKTLQTSMKRFSENGRLYAEANRNYRVIMRQEILRLKADGNPATLIEKLARGTPEVSTAEFNKIVAENAYKASAENINVQKLILKSIEEQITREWRG